MNYDSNVRVLTQTLITINPKFRVQINHILLIIRVLILGTSLINLLK